MLEKYDTRAAPRICAEFDFDFPLSDLWLIYQVPSLMKSSTLLIVLNSIYVQGGVSATEEL